MVETELSRGGQVRQLPPRASAAGVRSGRPRPSSPCRKAATSSARSASCPTRAAPNSRARSPSSIDEARRLVDQGVREITLLGQNVNAYHGDGPDGRPWSLARLIARLAGIDGLERLRYTTSHPRDMSDDLIAAHRDQPKLMPYLHLPFQAGADRILAAMNRKHTAADYLRLVERIRAARPDIALSTDIIVGFPGETEAEFEATLDDRARGRLRAGLLVQVQPAARHAGRQPWTVRSPRRSRPSGSHRLQAAARSPAGGLQRGLRRPDDAGAVRAAGPPRRPARRPLALPAGGARRSRRRRCSAASCLSKSRAAGPTACPAS